ncbi:MAG: hypothetical protein ACLP6E_07820, partial [Acidimicrobiales bacterium]
PKCRFVYLMLATALGREEMVTIFGSDLLGDPEQIDGFRDLVDIDRKPFECVGTREESIEALSELAASSNWAGSVVVQALGPALGDLGALGGGPSTATARSVASARRSPQQVLQTVRAATERIAERTAGATAEAVPRSRIRSA